jgi:phosphoglycerol transferase MdoB-like AlkP superfamily enzyme
MMDGSQTNDLKLMWQSQTREYPIMSAEEIRIKARTAQAKIRRNLIIAFGLSIVLLFLSVMGILEQNTPRRLVAAAFLVLTCVLAYRAYARLWSRSTLSPNVALHDCLEFYRRELGAQYSSLAIVWRFLVPIILFSFFSWNALLRTSPLVPRITLPSALALILIVRRHEVRKFRQKLAALDEFERENS